MTPASTGSGWTTGRIIALAAGSVLLLVSLVFIAGAGPWSGRTPNRSALALPWLAGELLAAGLVTGVAAGVLIVVPVRLASRRGPGATPP